MIVRINRVLGWSLLLLIILQWRNFTDNPVIELMGIVPVKTNLIGEVALAFAQGPLEQGRVENLLTGVSINAVPSTDGREVFVAVAGLSKASPAPFILNVDAGTGPAGHKNGYALTFSTTTQLHIATAAGFAPGQDIGSDGDDTMSITTTVGSQVASTGAINFQRAFIEAAQSESISVDEGKFVLNILNAGSVATDTYLLAMATNAPPGSLPTGHILAGNSYNIRAAGSMTQSAKPMSLNLSYELPLPGGAAPQSLAVLGWDAFKQRWDNLGGNLLDDGGDKKLNLTITRFRTYALATTPLWRDSFQSPNLSGVANQVNIKPLNGSIVLSDTNIPTGSLTSVPITPTQASAWGTLAFSATVPTNTTLTVDVLGADDSVLLTNVAANTDLTAAGITLVDHPILKLRANLSTAAVGQTPHLHSWQLSWIPRLNRVYLPLIIR